MFHITGAGLLYQGTSYAIHGDLVVVTINYRLGAFGVYYWIISYTCITNMSSQFLSDNLCIKLNTDLLYDTKNIYNCVLSGNTYYKNRSVEIISWLCDNYCYVTTVTLVRNNVTWKEVLLHQKVPWARYTIYIPMKYPLFIMYAICAGYVQTVNIKTVKLGYIEVQETWANTSIYKKFHISEFVFEC